MLTEKIQLDDDEDILIQVRKHWFILASQILGVLIMGMFPTTAYFVFVNFAHIDASLIDPYIPFLITLFSAWLLIVWMMLFRVWTNYYLDIWTITNKRLIAVDQRGLFNRNTGSFRLERLQDINVSIRGIIATFLDYGDLEAETASNDREFVARNIPKPQELKALIMSASDAVTYATPPQNIPLVKNV